MVVRFDYPSFGTRRDVTTLVVALILDGVVPLGSDRPCLALHLGRSETRTRSRPLRGWPGRTSFPPHLGRFCRNFSRRMVLDFSFRGTCEFSYPKNGLVLTALLGLADGCVGDSPSSTRVLVVRSSFFFFFSLISLIADGPHYYHPACGH